MTWVAAAIGGSAVLGYLSSENAASAQENAAAQSSGVQRDIFNRQVELAAPFREAGLTAQNRMLDLLGLSDRTGAAGYGSLNKPFGMEQFQTDPGYAFRMSEGLKALERSRAAAGGLLSGGAGKALEKYGQDLASQEYGNAFNRYQVERANQLNPLQSLTGAGQSQANVLGQQAGQYGANVGQNIMAAGGARGSAYIGGANAVAQGVGQYLNYNQNQNLLNAFYGNRMNSVPNYGWGTGNVGTFGE